LETPNQSKYRRERAGEERGEGGEGREREGRDYLLFIIGLFSVGTYNLLAPSSTFPHFFPDSNFRHLKWFFYFLYFIYKNKTLVLSSHCLSLFVILILFILGSTESIES
jgi:hypothetical protein